tara:strand:+ start:258 stop:536 length:279 start_codon:yes stop_codon:yes gene_type:complete
MDLSKYKNDLNDIGYDVSADQVINFRGDVIGQCDPYGSFICDNKEIMDIVSVSKKATKPKKKKYVRARDDNGHFIADDPETLDINEAWKEVK